MEIVVMVGQTADGTKFLVKTRVLIDPKTNAKQFQVIGTTTLEQLNVAIAALENDIKLLT